MMKLSNNIRADYKADHFLSMTGYFLERARSRGGKRNIAEARNYMRLYQKRLLVLAEKSYRVYWWKWGNAAVVKHGENISKENAEAWVKAMKKEYPELYHYKMLVLPSDD